MEVSHSGIRDGHRAAKGHPAARPGLPAGRSRTGRSAAARTVPRRGTDSTRSCV